MLKWTILIALVWATDFVYGGEIIEAPSNVSVALGTTATFRCVVRKDDGDEVHWLLNENLILFVERTIEPDVVFDEFRFSVIGTGNEYHLQITQVTVGDVGKYSCKIQPRLGSGGQPSHKTASLVVHRAPGSANPECSARRFDKVNKLTNVYRIGNELLFQCESERGYPTVSLDWTDENGVTVNTTLDDTRLNSVIRYFKRVLTPSDNGKVFTCMSMYTSSFVANQTGSCHIGPLNVQFRPTFIDIKPKAGMDENGNVDFGKSVLINCNGTGGNPAFLTYSWTITPPLPAERYTKSDHVLSIHSIEEEDQSRVIQCSARNIIGGIFSQNITINVTNIPTTTIPPTIITTEPPTTVKVIPPPSMPFSTTYIIIVILVALVILLATVCLVLFLVNRQKQPDVLLAHMPVSNMSRASSDMNQTYSRQISTNTWLDAEDDTCSLKGKGSRPGTPCMERRVADVELKLATMNSQYRAQDNVYGDSLGVQPEDSVSNVNVRASPLPHHRDQLSPDPYDDDLKKRRTPRDSPDSSTCSHCSHHSSRPYQSKTPNPEKPHKKLKPTNSTGPDWPKGDMKKNYSPLARRHYSPEGPAEQNVYDSSPQQPRYNTIDSRPRRATESELNEMMDYENHENFKKGHRRNRSHGSASLGGIVESPVSSPATPPVFTTHHHHGHYDSPVMQRKQKRHHSSSSLNQLQVLQQQQQAPSQSQHRSPRHSPRPSPHHSPAHGPHGNRPLPDPGLEHGNLLISLDDDGSYPGQQSYSHQSHSGHDGYGRHSMPRQMVPPQLSYNDDIIDEHLDDDTSDSSEFDDELTL